MTIESRTLPSRFSTFSTFWIVVFLTLSLGQSHAREAEYNPYGTSGGKQGTHSLFTTGPPNVFYHNVGLLEVFVSNIGRIGNGQLGLDSVSAGWRGGEYLYIGAMWIGAIASDNLAYVSTGGYDLELLPSLDPVDTIYPAFEGVTNGNRPGFSPQPDDDGDGQMDEEFLNGRDDDGDGRIDEDYAAVSQQMFTCEYWDYSDAAIQRNPEHRPLNLRVRQSSYSWSTAGSNEFIGFDFDIINDGFEVLRQVYLGFFVDSDAGPKAADGYWTDDAVALYSTDTTFVDQAITFTCSDDDGISLRDCGTQELGLDIMYMFDRPDDGEFATGGDVDGYFGGMFLGHTTDPFGERAPQQVEMHTARWFSGSNPYPEGDPVNDAERYDLLQSGERSRRGSGPPDDYRYTFAAGPFTEVLPGETLQLQVAFVIGQGKDGMIKNAVNAQRIYNGQWRDVDNSAETGQVGLETCLTALSTSEPQFWRDPCDSLAPQQLTIKDVDCLPRNYVDNDCDCCTPLFSNQVESETKGNETLVNWVGTVAPPPPGTNIDLRDVDGVTFTTGESEPGLTARAVEGDRAIVLEWDNLSELAADPIQARILFTGYRIWRVEGWARPVGAVGPAPTDWQLVADLSLAPSDSMGAESENYLPRYAKTNFDSTACLNEGRCAMLNTGADPLQYPDEAQKLYIPVGIYSFRDTSGLKNGMLYFYDVTAYSAWKDDEGLEFELESLPSATEAEGVEPRWDAVDKQGSSLDRVFVYPDPYITGENPDGWDLTPSDSDPTGTKILFAQLPSELATIKIFSLSGDLVQTISHDGRGGDGDAEWNLVSRNGQDIVSGVYLYSVDCAGDTKVGRFTIIR